MKRVSVSQITCRMPFNCAGSSLATRMEQLVNDVLAERLGEDDLSLAQSAPSRMTRCFGVDLAESRARDALGRAAPAAPYGFECPRTLGQGLVEQS
jgi:hypothetical protein